MTTKSFSLSKSISVALVLLALCVSTIAQQNGTDCASWSLGSEGEVLYLNLDHTCVDGDAVFDRYSGQGGGPHAACYAEQYGGGLTTSTTCNDCPPSNPNCTPDSPEIPDGRRQQPLFKRAIAFLDWVTA